MTSRIRRGVLLRVLAVTALIVGTLLLLFQRPAMAQSEPANGAEGALVDIVEIEGVIDQTIADFIVERLDTAAQDGAEVVVLQLDTPGGLGISMDSIVEAILASEVPVAVWVGPSGARAASAGTYIAYASHIVGMAPATTMGAATPVDLGGGDLEQKATNDAVTRLVALAELRGRDTDFARRAVTDGAVVAVGTDTTTELPTDVQLPPGLERSDIEVVSPADLKSKGYADLVAAGLPEMLAQMDGVKVGLGPAGDETTTLSIDPETAEVRFNNLGLVRRVLHTVANPTLAYLLLIGGALALLFEVFQPGFGVSGVSGIALLGLGLYGLSVLPVNWLAFGLVVIGLVLLAIDLAVAGLGALTAGGTIALTIGSFLLFSGPEVLRVSPWVIIPVVLFCVAFFVVIMTTVLRAQGNQAMTGAEGLEGRIGVVRSMLNPEGHVFVGGALWRARAPDAAGKVRTGTKVRVLGVDSERLTLDVELVESEEESSSSENTPVG